MHIIKYNRYPNNEIRVTHYYKRESPVVNPTIENDEGAFSCPDTASSPDGECVADSSGSLDISSDLLQSPEKKMRKRTKFGTNAKRTILRIGGAYDTIDPTPEHYVFLTGTIPGGTHDAFMAVAEQSLYVVRSVALWLKRTCPTTHWFYVWELQGRGALHIHYCLHAPNPDTRGKILREWWGKWHSIIQEVGIRSNADMWIRKDGSYHKEGHSVLQAYAQEVRKSVAAYMAGYCGGSKDKHKSDANSPYYPSRWWGCSRETTKLLRGLTEERVVEYSNYREASSEMKLTYESIRHDTPLAHHYPHKVGVGSTIASYHPEDKGLQIWSQLTTMIHSPQQFPNASSWIASLENYIRIWVAYSKILGKRKGIPSQSLLQDCEDILSMGSLSRYTLDRRTLRVIRNTCSECSLNMMLPLNRELIMRECVPPIWMLSKVESLLRWNPHGWLSLESDLPVRLTDCWSVCDGSTTDPEGEDAVPAETASQ